MGHYTHPRLDVGRQRAPVLMGARTITLTVHKGGRKYMSANDRPNRWVKAAQTKDWRTAGLGAALYQKAPALHGPVSIVATVHIADKRRREVSNLFPTFKAIIDGFVDAAVLLDDSDVYVQGPDPRRGYEKEPRIVFTLTELLPRG